MWKGFPATVWVEERHGPGREFTRGAGVNSDLFFLVKSSSTELNTPLIGEKRSVCLYLKRKDSKVGHMALVTGQNQENRGTVDR